VFSDAAVPSAQDWGNVQQYVANYQATLPALTARFAGTSVPLLVQPGIEIVAAGDLTLGSALDLSTWHPANAPLDFTVRAAGNLSVNATVSDGFVTNVVGNQSQITLAPGPSSSIRLVAGADISSADPTAVKLGSGNLSFAAQSVARTGTGDMSIAAGGDIVLAGAGSGAFTAGSAGVAAGGTVENPYASVPAPLGVGLSYGVGVPGPVGGQSGLLMSFPTQGGNLSVSAGGNIINTASTAASAVSSWELREGGGKTKSPLPNGTNQVPTSWGINLAAYDWNFGTLGGGDVSVTAGGNALNVSIAAADALLPPNGAPQQLLRSGSLDVRVGNDIGSAQLFQADGSGRVRAEGALTAILPALQGGDPNVGSALYLQSGSLSVSARTGMAVDGIYNPTGLGQVPNNYPSALPAVLARSYLSYGDASALTLESTTGDIDLGTAVSASPTLLGSKTNNLSGTVNNASGDVLPPELIVQATSGSIVFGQGLGGAGGAVTLAPSAQGQLVLLAGENILNPTGNARLTMSDAAPGSYPSLQGLGGTSLVESQPFNANLHTGDLTPALVSAGVDISNLNLSLPKAAQIVAGRDIIDVTYAGENLNAGDLTLLSAGRDLEYSSGYGGGNGISVGGPGQLDLLAGRNISLGFSLGVISTGNLFNANLPTASGADITMVSGLKSTPDVDSFLTKIVAPSQAYQAQLVNYVEGLEGSTALNYSQAQATFESLSPAAQLPLLDAVFFNELLLSGRAANSVPGVGFSEGYAAIDALFPGSRTAATNALPGAFGGDLSLDFSRIYTLSGGNINLVVPGGGLDVGLANPPAILGNRAPSTLGIVAEGAGNVDIFTKTDVNVNASRIFTLGGGNIEIWSDEGSIDAGRGAKTAVSAPPPTVLINSDGTVSLNFSGAAAGSGIRTIQTNPATPPGNVDLIAPVGTVNAGDAGIGAAGNINIAARSVVGLDNINFGGTASGVPAQVSNIGASLSGASSAASASSNTAAGAVSGRSADNEAAAPLAAGALSWLDVFVTGLGEDNCPPSDIECLKRQKTPNH
jgi:filamentous hemagglutinin